MGEPGLATPDRWGPIAHRERDRAEIDARVGAWTGGLTRDEALAVCAEFQVPCGPVYAIDEIFEDPHYASRGNIAFVDDKRAGSLALPNVVPRLTETPGRIDGVGPALGNGTETVLEGLLGMSKERVAELRAAGVV